MNPEIEPLPFSSPLSCIRFGLMEKNKNGNPILDVHKVRPAKYPESHSWFTVFQWSAKGSGFRPTSHVGLKYLTLTRCNGSKHSIICLIFKYARVPLLTPCGPLLHGDIDISFSCLGVLMTVMFL